MTGSAPITGARSDLVCRHRHEVDRGPRSGFTFLELIAVIAALALLAGVVAPVVTGDIDIAKLQRAQAETEAIADALANFQATVGAWPTMDGNGRLDRLLVLITGTQIPSRNPYTRGHAFWRWARGSRGDLLGHHLVANSPRGQQSRQYPTAGAAAWLGPYLDTSPLDPWGRPYIVNVIASYSNNASRHRRLWVMSAGPDGQFQTSANAGLNDDVAGDDVGYLVYQR